MKVRLAVSLVLGGLISLSLAMNWFLLMPLDSGSKLAGIVLAAMPLWAMVVMFMLCDSRRLRQGLRSWGLVLVVSVLVNGVFW
ncbi:hypothetical protein [Gallaecimonas xiamenensis]|uniref:Uncharacterized protein n=1 Tax=Gallaecimonas xiamenensis 3-C-1 TaxID=745411 RepID=K2J3X3_9GAMM|nr:hypothetical protein [Gallaecimonas xiamenensis]EKE69577.1 hypothetical protein B3C1_14827 [Gallaecimonas xiamenensis 3-C-1]